MYAPESSSEISNKNKKQGRRERITLPDLFTRSQAIKDMKLFPLQDGGDQTERESFDTELVS